MKQIRNLMMMFIILGMAATFSSCGEGNEPEGTYIEIDAIPQIILDYIANNYPGTQIEEAEVYPNGDYEIALDNGLELVFDTEGTFIQEGD